MGTMISTGTDVVTFLQEQHEEIKALFEQVLSTTGQAREKAFFMLRRMIAVHETAEEQIAHPAARRALPDGEAIVRLRLHEEKMAKQDLSAIERLDVGSVEFDAKLQQLKATVLAHAAAEERDEFHSLASVLEPARLERMRKAAEFAESVAPTHPHSGVESAAANMLLGPFAAMVDRTRDAFAGKT